MGLKNVFNIIQPKKRVTINKELKTIWSDTINPKQILNEYPRPQLKRREYYMLNGEWEYTIRKDHEHPEEYEGTILVPFSPEAPLSGVNHILKPGEVLWYRRTILIPTIPVKKRCILHFGAVDQICQVFVNGYKVKEHIGGYLSFECEIQEYLYTGENEITVKVTDHTDHSYHSRGKQSLTPGGIFYTSQSGIWQSVWMEWVPMKYIRSMKVTPYYDESKITINFKLSEHTNPTSGETTLPIKVTILENNRILQEKTANKKLISIHVPHKISWSPEQPFLYELKIEYGDDRVESYFAMRKISVEKDKEGVVRIHLNNKPYYQQGVLDQGYWPESLYTAPSDEAMIYDIMKMKELGYNMIRKHIKIEPSRWYYHCDRLGMLVWQDMVNGGEKYHKMWVGVLPVLFPSLFTKKKDRNYSLFARKNEQGRLEWKRECWNTINQLYHFPCIIVWVLFNEGWGQFDTTDIERQIKKHDRMRLIDQASGWFDQNGGDIKSVHNYIRKQKMGHDHRAYAITELGGYACKVDGHTQNGTKYGYQIYDTTSELKKAYEKLYEEELAPLVKQGLSATVYTQLSDVEDEINGLLTYDRKVCKVDRIQPIDIAYLQNDNQDQDRKSQVEVRRTELSRGNTVNFLK